jgi:ATP-dependent Clp protease protease subunit
MNVWPPVPFEPPHPRRFPWQPDPAARPPAPSPGSPGWSLVVDTGSSWLSERLVERRLVALAGELNRDAANQVVAELALLDATGDEPVTLQLSGLSADLDTTLTVVDALDLMGVDVHATCLGTISGPAVAILAVANQRIAGPHATVHLCEPRFPLGVTGRDLAGGDLESHAHEYQRQLRLLQERIAEACRRPVDEVADDMRVGRILTAAQARDYGLVDTCASRAPMPPSSEAQANEARSNEAEATVVPPGHRQERR